MLVLAAIPLLMPFVMLLLLRQNGLHASLASCVVALACACAFVPADSTLSLALHASGQAVAIGFGVLSVLWPGLLLYRLQVRSGGLDVITALIRQHFRQPPVQLLALLLGVSPFVEAISGFGVSVLVVAPLLLALGHAPLQAGTLALLSQISVPLGALGVGTMVGAQLGGQDVNAVGTGSLLLSAPLPALCALLMLYVADRAGGISSTKSLDTSTNHFYGSESTLPLATAPVPATATDPADTRHAFLRHWPLALLAGAIKGIADPLLTHAFGVEVAGALASLLTLGVILLAGQWQAHRHAPPTSSTSPIPRPRQLAATGPYLLLIACLLLTRGIAPLQHALQSHWVIEPFGAGFRYPLAYIPGFWVLLAALSVLIFNRMSVATLLHTIRTSWAQFWPAGLTILFFLLLAQLMTQSGMAAQLAQAGSRLGQHYAWVAPVLAALGGWLTGSNTGGNAMFVPLQVAAAHQVGLAPGTLVAMQNAVASYATMGSPARAALVAATLVSKQIEQPLVAAMIRPVLLAITVIALLYVGTAAG